MHFLTTIIVTLSLATALMQAAPLGDLFDTVGDTLDQVIKRDIPDLIEREASYCSE